MQLRGLLITATTCDFQLTFYSNYGSLVLFLRYSMSKMSWPWNQVRVHSRSLKVVPFD